MPESDYYKPMIVGANLEAWALYRIADGGWDKKPFDIGGFGPAGEGVALEVKLLKVPQDEQKPLPWRVFEDQQIRWLRALASRVVGLALVALIDPDETITIYEMHTPDFLNLRACEFQRTVLQRINKPARFYKGWSLIPMQKVHRELIGESYGP